MKTIFKATLILGLSVLASSAAIASPEVHAPAAPKLTFPSGDYSFQMTMVAPNGKKMTKAHTVKITNTKGVLKIVDPKNNIDFTGKLVKGAFTSELKIGGGTLKYTGKLVKGSVITGKMEGAKDDGTQPVKGTFEISPTTV